MQNTGNSRVVPTVLPTKQEARLDLTKPRRLAIIRDFALNTSTHGLPGIARSQSKHNCIFWTISFLIFTGVMIYFVTRSIQNYFQYPTQTSVSIFVERSQVFPAVTFCNYSPARFDRLAGPFLNYLNSINATNTKDTETFTREQYFLLSSYFQHLVNTGQSVSEYFFSLDIMLIECVYNTKTCTHDDFISFISSAYGKCYTFNAKSKSTNGTSLRYTNDNGGSGKLILRLYAQSHLYSPHINEVDVSAGMVTMIHDNTQLPLINVAGILLTPGRKHKLGYKKKQYTFLPSPYTYCTTNIPRPMRAMFDQYEGADYAYSQGVCYTLCTQAYIYEQCGCVSPYEWSARSIVLPGTNKIAEAPLCNLTDVCYTVAGLKITKISSIWDQYCSHCHQECSTVTFALMKSSIAAPSMPFIFATKAHIESLPIPLPANWSTNWLSEIQNNYVSLEVVCESNQVENYTEEASVTAVSVLSSVGGHTGLWIGISFLSIMEFIEMLYRLCRYEFHSMQQIPRNRFNNNN
ncbi:unnamed protein product [Rotaria socialis]|uniref:Uncharacterized protein n=1 Tax=Rotaria socialis TaxID=392032 RepID=A0A817VFF3_9BILA|nr:unnamed protein product [Rotaria socialis]